VILNDRVGAVLKSVQSRKSLRVAFERGRRYVAMMRRIFRQKDLPVELVNLAFVESEMNPRATSPANAAGIWQFMPSTARRYGLRTGTWLDERRDPEKSTRGAAEHLRRLYARFRSWPLALAAYNAGEATVQRAVERQRTRDFWQLHLPEETRHFVPRVMAMTLIARDPERYGFAPIAEEPYETELLHVDHPTEIRLIADAAGSSVSHLQELNPELVQSATPPNHPRYAIRLPRGLAQTAKESLEGIPPESRVGWLCHRVKRGETLEAIARRYGVGVQALRDLNDLAARQAPRPGAVLLIPSTAPPA
jgi:membrane-bound lytic murein transglycosylase D